jgi:hypothetical protein
VFVLRLLIVAAVVAALAGTVWWIWRVRPVAGRIVAVGVVLRVTGGLATFAISYWRLPIFADLHQDPGFWDLAPDAAFYYSLASRAARSGLELIDWGGPSPLYVWLLALALRLFGDTPATSILLNLIGYVASCALLTRFLAAPSPPVTARAAIVTLASITFSPILLLSGTQALKDNVFSTLVVLALTGAALALGHPAHRLAVLLGGGMLWTSLFAIAGIRFYYALFLWAVVTGVLVLFIVHPGWTGLGARLIRAAGLPVLLWTALMSGGGPYYHTFTAPLRDISLLPSSWRAADRASPVDIGGEVVARMDEARSNFIRAGGATNVGATPRAQQRRRDVPDAGPGVRERLESSVVGLSLLVLPVSLLRALSVVDFSGGRGLLFVADIDTVFTVAMALAGLACVVGCWADARRNVPFVACAGLLAVATALSMAYVVTNYGTLWRLRLMMAMPLWLLPLALSRLPSSPHSTR